MSEAVSALHGAAHEAGVTVRDAGLVGMITLRGDLSDAGLQKACTDLTGAAFPETRQITEAGGKGLAWMSPDELLILMDYADVPAAVQTLSDKLSGTHHLIADVSDARAVFTLDGPFVRDVLAKLSPADLAALQPGELRRTRLAQSAAAFHMTGETSARIVCFRSVAAYVFGLLSTAADGGPVTAR